MTLQEITRRRLAAFTVVALSAVVVASALAAPGDRRSDREKRAKDRLFSEEFSLKAGGQLVVDVDDMDIRIETRSGAGGSVEVYGKGSNRERVQEYFEELRFEAHMDGDKLVIKSDQPHYKHHSFWQYVRRVHLLAVITVPERTDLDIETEDGDVRLDKVNGRTRIYTEDGDLELSDVRGPSIELETEDGDVRAQLLEADKITLMTEDGDVQVDRIKGGRVRVVSSDGDIELRQIDADDVSVEAEDGDVELTVAAKKLTAECSDGDLVVTLLKEMAVDLRTDDGDIEINIAKNIGADLDLRGGHVSVRSKIAIKGNVSRRSVRGEINDGGPTIRAKSDDGTILVREG